MRLNSGLTLIQILVILAVLAMLTVLAMTAVTSAQEKSRVVTCKLQLRTTAESMKAHIEKNGTWPPNSGTAFLLESDANDKAPGLVKSDFRCPGIQDDRDVGHAISYAWRNNLEHSIDINHLDEMVIAADANNGRGNHKYMTNVAYADGSVAQYDARDYKDELELHGVDYVIVGTNSPIAELRVLNLE